MFCAVAYLLNYHHSLHGIRLWPKLDEDAQEKYLLDAFKRRAFSTDVGSLVFTCAKLDCPELCREELIQAGGRGIVTLLKSFLFDNNDDPPKKPIIFPIHDLTQSLVGLKETRIHSSPMNGWLELTLSVGYVVWSKSECAEVSASLGVFLQLFTASYTGLNLPPPRKFARDRHHAKGTLHHVRHHLGEVLGSSDAKKWMNLSKPIILQYITSKQFSVPSEIPHMHLLAIYISSQSQTKWPMALTPSQLQD